MPSRRSFLAGLLATAATVPFVGRVLPAEEQGQLADVGSLPEATTVTHSVEGADTVLYFIESGPIDFEYGIGTVQGSALIRETVLGSSLGGPK